MTLDEIRDRATITVEEAGTLLGIGRSAAYEAAKRGEIPTLRIGRRLLVPVPKLLSLLGMNDHESEPATPPEHRSPLGTLQRLSGFLSMT